MGMRIASAVWGFAEATLFFLVPDVLLTDRAVVSLRAGLICCQFALAGALLGGAVMYGWGLHHHESAVRALDYVPAVSAAMVDGVGRDLRTRGLPALLLGSVTGRPYKIYAVQAPAAGIGLFPFLAVSVPGRLIRFLAVTLLASLYSRLTSGIWSPDRKRGVMLGAWAAFYVVFFTLMPN